MSMNRVPSGKSLPEDFNTVVEIPMESKPIKYEVDKESDALFVDRFIPVAMFYPFNYGYIPQTLAEDGDAIDVLLLTPYPVQAGSVVRSRPVGVLMMEDESGGDVKIIAVPHPKLTQAYDHIQDIDDILDLDKKRLVHFFEQYKALEKGKWVKMDAFENCEKAKALIEASVKSYKG